MEIYYSYRLNLGKICLQENISLILSISYSIRKHNRTEISFCSATNSFRRYFYITLFILNCIFLSYAFIYVNQRDMINNIKLLL